MSKIREIFQSVRPLLGWRSRSKAGETPLSPEPKRAKSQRAGAQRRNSLVVPGVRGREKIEWVPVVDTAVVGEFFKHFRDCIFQLKQRSKPGAGLSGAYMWEAGKLAGSRPYFYLQAWSERGFLVEEAPKGWVIARAEKIASQSQFIRDRLAWDHVMLYQAENAPGMVKVSSVKMGESLVSLALYEDFMLRSIRETTDPTAGTRG